MRTRAFAAAAALCAAAAPAAAFEKIALVDGNDYAPRLDAETADGVARTIARVMKTGADVVLWRTHSGAMPRYRTRAEDVRRLEHPLDVRRLPGGWKVFGWVRHWRMEPDQLLAAAAECAKRPQVKTFGVHIPAEEAHWHFQYLGSWNLEHPQYWSRAYDGTVGMTHCSFAYPEVREHRLALVREILERNPAMVYLDTTRNGGYGPMSDYVKPNLEKWAARHPGVPVPSDWRDRRWCEIVAESHLAFYRGIRGEIRKTGRKIPFMLSIGHAREKDDFWNLEYSGVDWRKAVDEGLVDALAVVSMSSDPEDPFGSSERIFKSVVDFVRGRCKVYFPVRGYNFNKAEPSYVQLAEWGGVPRAEALGRLLEIAARCGAAGIVMDCVDPEDVNYPDADARVIREFDPGAAPAPAK